MPHPKNVFESPDKYWSFLTASNDADFEGQYFDRKEAGRKKTTGVVDKNTVLAIVNEITECISAFANSNKDGGLLVLGISTKGEIKGLNHLSDEQRNTITHINSMLSNQAADAKFFDCPNDLNEMDKICLIYVPYTIHGICETLGNHPKAWLRQGAQNIFVNSIRRDQLRRDKRITDFEQAYCCDYDPADIDQAVLTQFRENYPFGIDDYNTEELLYQVGALLKIEGRYAFTNAGYLFFASNPQRKLAAAYVRLLRFNALIESFADRGLPTFERSFSGPITKQIRDVRTFFQESGFFKTYQKRNSNGGFVEEPEFPYISIDEAIVNAIVHRDYAMSIPIECEAYKGAFLVRNSGRVLQRDHDVPSHFSLENISLVSTPRNPKLIEWLKIMRDSRGSAFIQALSEGTKRMQQEMVKLHLPSPTYNISETQTAVMLFSNANERERLLQSNVTSSSTEFTNLFLLSFVSEDVEKIPYENIRMERHIILKALSDVLAANGWFIDNLSFGKLVAHRQKGMIYLLEKVARTVNFYPAYSFQLRSYWGHHYLCVDYTLEVKNIKTVAALLAYFNQNDLVGRKAVAQWKGWKDGKIIVVDQEWTRLYLFDIEQEVSVENTKVIPNLPTMMIEQMLLRDGTQFDLYQSIKEHSLSLESGASRIRIEKMQSMIDYLTELIFPLVLSSFHVYLQPAPVPLTRHSNSDGDGGVFQVKSLPEPRVEFNHHQEAIDIRAGITTFGAYGNSPKIIELIPICTAPLYQNMAALIDRLKSGKYKYRGSERTFSTRFTYKSIITIPSPSQALNECKRLIKEHPEWVADENLSRLFLVYSPEKGYASDDEKSPYYSVKRFLFEQGLPCQMLNTPTLQNPDWKDLNLALNVAAKCGVTPWVLPDAIPDADFFVGLSYTGNERRGAERLMGYANVFNQYGRWEFYSGNTAVFSYTNRAEYFRTLIRQTLERLTLSENPSIYFHYSAKFSREDRLAILEAARSVRPQGTYSFVWINTHHSVRLYDSRVESNGSLSRGSYVITSPYQCYLSTTGQNPYRKTLGTPKMLEVNVTVERPKGLPNAKPDLRALATQLLSLTKLNWASTDSLCAEPITIKYAGDIAYLTSAFLRQGQPFNLHKALEKTPWFI